MVILMELLSILALTIFAGYFIIDTMIRKYFNSKDFIRYSQSNIHDIIKDYIPKPERLRSNVESQSMKHENSNRVKVIITEDKAFWVMNNNFYTANVIDGSIDKGSAEIVDTFNLDKEELDKMLFILDQLKNGN